jgi:hypothetical protein
MGGIWVYHQRLIMSSAVCIRAMGEVDSNVVGVLQ